MALPSFTKASSARDEDARSPPVPFTQPSVLEMSPCGPWGSLCEFQACSSLLTVLMVGWLWSQHGHAVETNLLWLCSYILFVTMEVPERSEAISHLSHTGCVAQALSRPAVPKANPGSSTDQPSNFQPAWPRQHPCGMLMALGDTS